MLVYCNSWCFCNCSLFSERSKEMGNKHSQEGSGPSIPKLPTGTSKSVSVKEHVNRASKTGVLKLNKANLKDFPAQLLELKDILRNLDLTENKLLQIPSDVGEFLRLKQLHLDGNRLNFLADEVGKLKKLETLSLNDNQLSAIPDSLISCTSLKTVNLSGNRISNFPVPLCHLTNLDLVDLSRNQVQAIPPEIASCKALEINLNQNRLNTLPEELSECPRLKVLRVEENCLSLAAFSPKILAESQISLFALEGNLFQEKDFHHIDGYEQYMERFTASRKKMY